MFLILHFLFEVHTFYEAVGIMISAQVNTKIQEQLIDKYMLLPNLIWDDCISQASKVKYMNLLKIKECVYFI